ncbi:hypothetical protein B5F40_11985 [Gordonibacter sp. An230]|uniref:hypothetical protein n=1 Tax=Gordonibacter sp. An230 TaxID=1965592 RepID=UPI000B3AA52D|nr:hypothetical protein [Gordonibacter sp. An230]OUO88921.1 hypothetical protein B5F40_11985 [Gordonibacter sp. An230]
MTIEIRPAAVMEQIERKKEALEALRDEAASKLLSVEGFSQDTLLTGAGWQASKDRIASYGALLSALTTAAERTMQADERVSSALAGYFEGCERVSEREWLDRQSDALSQARLMEERARWALHGTVGSAGLARMYEEAAAFAYDAANLAGDMLSKVYSYCDETNGAYEGDLADLTSCLARGCAAVSSSGFDAEAGRWGALDMSWSVELREKAAKVADQVLLEATRKEPGMVCVSEDGAWAYVSGKRFPLAGTASGLLSSELIAALAETGLGASIDLAALKAELDGKATASDVLRAVGIEKAGTYRFTSDGKIVFSGFTMAEGAQKMTTRISADNIGKHARPGAVFAAEEVEAAAKAKASGLRAGGGLLSMFFVGAGAASAYGSTYKEGEGKDEDRRRSDAEAAAIGSLAAAGAGALEGAVAGLALGGPAGVVVGAVVGLVFSQGVETYLESDLDGDGRTVQGDIDEWWYAGGGHAFANGCAEAFWEQLVTAPTGMAR